MAERESDKNKNNNSDAENLEKDWNSLNERLERIIRKLSRQEMRRDQDEARVQPEKDRERPREHKQKDTSRSGIFKDTSAREEDETMHRLEREKEHLKELRDKLEQLQQGQRPQKETERFEPKHREREHPKSSFTNQEREHEKSQEEYGPEYEADRPVHGTQELEYGEIDTSDDKPSSGFIEKRSKTEAFLLGVLTGMVILFLINMFMVPPATA